MEYDNDRIISPPPKMQIFYWILVALINPLVNALTIFFQDPGIWVALFFTNLMVLPLYVLYSRFVVPEFLFKKKYVLFVAASLVFVVLTQAFLYCIYAIIYKLASPVEDLYFTYSMRTLFRECLWTAINMVLAFTIAMLKKSFDERELIAGLQRDNTAFKLKYLQSQLNPHFLFNTLNSIYSLSLQKSEKAPEVIIRLADIMRYLIYECNESKILLDNEIEFVRNYIEIEKMRYNADIQFTVVGNTSGVFIEPFLFISFIENGFKHALNDSFNNPFVYVTITVTDTQIELTVINNTNIDLETQAKRIDGTSIKNSKSMLELLYPDSYALNIIQTDIHTKNKSMIRLRNAKERLKVLYPDKHTLDVILSNNTFTVSLIVNPQAS
jgi:two-component system, LytTR family, sensor kinase